AHAHRVERVDAALDVARAVRADALHAPHVVARAGAQLLFLLGADEPTQVVDDPARARGTDDLGHDVGLHVEVTVAVEHAALDRCCRCCAHDSAPFSARAMSSRRSTLPTAVRGIASSTTRRSGALYRASCSVTHDCTSSRDGAGPTGTTTATPISPHRSSAIAT